MLLDVRLYVMRSSFIELAQCALTPSRASTIMKRQKNDLKAALALKSAQSKLFPR
jgi:hypothetical protein